MSGTHFYLTLLSNASLNEFPNNKTASYADRTGLFQQAIMDYGYYQSMQELIKAANKALSRNVSDNITLTYNAFTGKVTVQIKNGFQFAVMKPLSIILGFGGKDVILKKRQKTLTWQT